MLMKNLKISHILHTQRWIDLLREFVRECVSLCIALFKTELRTLEKKAKYSVGLQDKYESMTLLRRALVVLALVEQSGLSALLKDSEGKLAYTLNLSH